MTKISYPDYAKSNSIVHFLSNNIMTTYKGLVLHLKFCILKWKTIHPNDEINTGVHSFATL